MHTLFRPLACLIAIALLLFSCQKTGEDEVQETKYPDQPPHHWKISKTVVPPIQGAAVPFRRFVVKASQPQELEYDSGTKLSIPAGAIVDENGKPVEGMVEIRYREFHDVADILLSGIPMRYDSAGQSYILQSAGMAELRAYQGHQELSIAEGKEIGVEMVSGQKGAYSLYTLNEQNGTWNYENEASTISEEPEDHLEAHDSQTTKLAPLPPKPIRAQKDEVVFDFETNYRDYPELAAYDGIQWQYAGVEQEGSINPNENEWIFGEVWHLARVRPINKEKAHYLLLLKNKQKQVEMVVSPVLEGKDYKAAMAFYEETKRKHAEVRKMVKEEKERKRREALAVRTFKAGNFGFYNWDRIMKKGDLRQIAADFTFRSKAAILKRVLWRLTGYFC